MDKHWHQLKLSFMWQIGVYNIQFIQESNGSWDSDIPTVNEFSKSQVIQNINPLYLEGNHVMTPVYWREVGDSTSDEKFYSNKEESISSKLIQEIWVTPADCEVGCIGERGLLWRHLWYLYEESVCLSIFNKKINDSELYCILVCSPLVHDQHQQTNLNVRCQKAEDSTRTTDKPIYHGDSSLEALSRIAGCSVIYSNLIEIVRWQKCSVQNWFHEVVNDFAERWIARVQIFQEFSDILTEILTEI